MKIKSKKTQVKRKIGRSNRNKAIKKSIKCSKIVKSPELKSCEKSVITSEKRKRGRPPKQETIKFNALKSDEKVIMLKSPRRSINEEAILNDDERNMILDFIRVNE